MKQIRSFTNIKTKRVSSDKSKMKIEKVVAKASQL